MSISAEELTVISGIFEEKGWPKDRFFDAFCSTFDRLENNRQKELLIGLTRRFLYIPLSKYTEELVNATGKLIHAVRQDSIIFLNGLPVEDSGKVKSNYLISYQFKGSTLKKLIDFGNRKIHVANSINDVLKYKDLKQRALVLVDDYIGSGLTLECAFDSVRKKLVENGKDLPKFYGLCIVAMRHAVERLEKSDIRIFASHILDKGISEYYKGAELDQAIETMAAIELQLKIKEEFAFGYGHSEALVCMERCPNNTFPIFWKGRPSIYER